MAQSEAVSRCGLVWLAGSEVVLDTVCSMKTEFADAMTGIRPYRPEDAQALFAAVRGSATELSPWMPWCTENYSLADSVNYVSTRDAEWEKGDDYSFLIYDLRDGGYLGGVGLNHINRENHFANLGYWVRTNRRGKGIAPAAVRLIARFGFEELKFMRLEIVAAVGNKPSQRVAEKSGAVREGVLRNRLALQEKQHDAVVYSLTPGGFENLNLGRG